jgi:hypothetical protein
MDNPTVLTGIAAIITALGTLIGLVINLINQLKKNTATTNDTNAMVNNSHDEQTSRLDQLTQTVVSLGGTVPIDPAIASAQQRVQAHGEATDVGSGGK